MKTNSENNHKLSLLEHIQIRPTMYIGRLGDGTLPDDGIYILLKEVINNAIDELERRTDGQIEVILLNEHRISIRDNGNGIPLDKLTQYVTIEEPFFSSTISNKSIGLHGYGIKILIALSSHFEVSSYNKAKARTVIFQNGLIKEDTTRSTNERDGLQVSAVNMSCGYYDPHSDHEFTVKRDLLNCLSFVEHIIKNCTETYPHEYDYKMGGFYGFDDYFYDEYYDEIYELLQTYPDLTFGEVEAAYQQHNPRLDRTELKSTYEMVKNDLDFWSKEEEYYAKHY